jgi:hypothetical protein
VRADSGGNRRLTGDLGMTNTFTACVIRTNELFLFFPGPILVSNDA